MMHAFLFIGATADIRQHKIQEQITGWNISPFDVITLAPKEEHISIDEVRALKRRLKLTPMKSDYMIGVIYQAKSMTHEAQNAILKLLEEPPLRVRLLIESENTNMLLPTIVSRCEVVRVVGVNDVPAQIPLVALMNAEIGERLTMLDAYTKDRVQTKAFVEDALVSGETMLHSGGDVSTFAVLLSRLLAAQAQLSVNCNPRLVLDRVFLYI